MAAKSHCRRHLYTTRGPPLPGGTCNIYTSVAISKDWARKWQPTKKHWMCRYGPEFYAIIRIAKCRYYKIDLRPDPLVTSGGTPSGKYQNVSGEVSIGRAISNVGGGYWGRNFPP